MPDVVFELVSPADNFADVDDRIGAFIANGVRAGVKLEPSTKTVTIFRPGLAPEASTTALIEMPGFVLDAAKVFWASQPRRAGA